MKKILLLVIYLIATGCQSKVKQITIQTLEDVHTQIDSNEDSGLTDEFFVENDREFEEIEEEVPEVKKNKPKRNSYESVPTFEETNSETLRFKRKNTLIEKIVVKGGKVKVTVEDIPVPQFIDLVFSKVLNVNYTVSKEVKALKSTITLNINKPESKQQVFEVVKEILRQEGIDTHKENNTFFLSKKGKKSGSSITNYIGYGRSVDKKISDSKDIIQFVPYYYVKPKSTVGILRKAGFSTLDFYYPINGIQMIKGKAGKVRQALKLIELVDRTFLKGKNSYLVNLDYIDVSKFSKRIKDIFNIEGITVSNTLVEGGLLMSEISELNSLFVISPNESWFKKILYWKEKLDIQSEIEFQEAKVYTYKVKHRKADELATAINSILQMQSKSLGESNVTRLSSSPLQQGSSTVTADLFSNTLMMKLLPTQYKALLPFIQKLDVYPLQVMVEVTVAEVSLTDTFSLGFEYALKNNAALSGVSNLLNHAVTAVLGRDTGVSATYTSKNLGVVINAFAQKKLLNILSKPKMVILNNQTGSINVGQQIPIINSENSAEDLANSGTKSSILRNISYRNTGITLNLTPTINSDGLLTMTVSLTLSEAQLNDTSSIDSPLIVNRSLSTSLVMKSGDNVLLGGLIASNNSTTEGGVPILRDIPFVGNIFKGDSRKQVKTELIMLIRPIIIKNSRELLNYSENYETIMESIKKL